MNWSDKTRSVRVDFFKGPPYGASTTNGKWYTTEAVLWPDECAYDGGILIDQFVYALIQHLGSGSSTRLKGMMAVCLDPYHADSHPLVTLVPEHGF